MAITQQRLLAKPTQDAAREASTVLACEAHSNRRSRSEHSGSLGEAHSNRRSRSEHSEALQVGHAIVAGVVARYI